MDAREAAEKACLAPWKQDNPRQVNLIRLEPGRLSQFKDGTLRFQRIVIAKGQILSLDFAGDKQASQNLQVKESRPILTTSAGREVVFLKLKNVPRELTISSLVSSAARGALVVGRLEDRSRVDDFRRDIGLPSLAKYLERYKQDGQKVRIVE
jgi:hypothetical protein